MWTVNTHIIMAIVALLFEQIFAPSSGFSLFEIDEIQNLVQRLLQLLRDTSTTSQISRKGVRIIECLLELRETMSSGNCGDFDLEQIISYVKLDVLQHMQIPFQTGVHGTVFGAVNW